MLVGGLSRSEARSEALAERRLRPGQGRDGRDGKLAIPDEVPSWIGPAKAYPRPRFPLLKRAWLRVPCLRDRQHTVQRVVLDHEMVPQRSGGMRQDKGNKRIRDQLVRLFPHLATPDRKWRRDHIVSEQRKAPTACPAVKSPGHRQGDHGCIEQPVRRSGRKTNEEGTFHRRLRQQKPA